MGPQRHLPSSLPATATSTRDSSPASQLRPHCTPHLSLSALASPGLPLVRGKARGVLLNAGVEEEHKQHSRWYLCTQRSCLGERCVRVFLCNPCGTCSHGKQPDLIKRTLTLSPSATWQITSPVAGLIEGKVFLLTASCHSLFMKICNEKSKAVLSLRGRPW